MTERPILFRGEMILALLSGKKTQTRRVVKPQPAKWVDTYGPSLSALHWLPAGVILRDDGGFLGKGPVSVRGNDSPVRCPYGAVGDVLWCRETHLIRAAGECVVYKADLSAAEAAGVGAMYGGWKPSIFMPRWASRISLEIVSVRVERLQSISGADAIAEGVPTEPFAGTVNGEPATIYPVDPVYQFAVLWNSINGVDSPVSWNASPWVWCLEFRRIK